ncbi:alpha-hydroxy acid oxidase [Basilea psittacipulmonis]|uniref:Lactate dehydrogenase n=1 Tax=Basilea psittacipulmonis DSM 24701 TaxID=1072685 RepID=A0A077DFL9_9BURK|nr:alpha-hydroxy acid oxidase [Basilea psittacipulmonis]AIL32971.1 lactate dehydrogenase [Basilea psittacipulmonis DSM 24701]
MLFSKNPDLSKITCIKDLEKIGRIKVPRMFYDYCNTGSWTQSTYHHNVDDLQKLKFKQRVAIDMEGRNTRSQLLGQDVSMPLALSPVGLTGMQRADGEILAAKAAERFGVPFTLSTMSICSIEDVAEHTTKPFWFQLYFMRDRSFMADLIKRAHDAGCSTLVVTLDLQVLGQRHRDIKNGLSTPPKPTIRNLLDLALRPEWCWHMLQTKRRQFGNIVGHVKGVSDMSSLSSWTADQFDPRLSWDDIEWIKERWDRKLIIKGIMEPEDAQLAHEHGADAIVVSNHGGRQLDGAPSTIDALPRIVDLYQKLNSKTEIYMDSGIRTGQDILRALALGAKGVMIGRAFIYGLQAYGEAGVYKALSILQKELETSMAFCGCTEISQLSTEILHNYKTWIKDKLD